MYAYLPALQDPGEIAGNEDVGAQDAGLNARHQIEVPRKS
jgi:hypothetical protein